MVDALSAAWSEVTLLPRQVKVRHDRWSISLDEVVLIALVATITARYSLEKGKVHRLGGDAPFPATLEVTLPRRQVRRRADRWSILPLSWEDSAARSTLPTLRMMMR